MNIVLISIDSLRRDRLGCYNPEKSSLAPHLEELAAGGAVFQNHYTVSNGSNPSHCSILTGAYPVRHGVHQNGWKLPTAVPTLASELQKAGYYTVGVVSLETLSSAYGLSRGFDKYFDNSRYDNIMRLASKLGYRRYTLAKFLQHAGIFDTHSRPYHKTNSDVLRWLDHNAHKKFFLFVHYFDIHRDTFGREHNRLGKEYKEENYDNNVRISDEAVRHLVNKLKEKNVFDDTLMVVLSDHGETLYEKYNKVGHGWDICPHEFHTPLVMYYPKRISSQQVLHLSRTIDVMPTILDFAGSSGTLFDGKSFLPILLGNKTEDVPQAVIMENYAGFRNIKAIKKDNWFYILRDDHKEELYNDLEDEQLDHDVLQQHQEVAQRLRAALEIYYRDKKEEQEADDYTKEMLRKLGYLD